MHVAEHVTIICHHSINISVFPNKWMKAKVTPLHKGGPSEVSNNYQPISILLVLSNYLRSMFMTVSLTGFLHNFKLLRKTPSGFRAGHSCETTLIHKIDSWLHAFDNGQIIGVVSVDFKKAFEFVDHQILLSKLEIYGIKDESRQ